MKTMTALVMLIMAAALKVKAGDPEPLQDFCVADLNNQVKVNGYTCKGEVSEDDFVLRASNATWTTHRTRKLSMTVVDVQSLPGLNTLGVSMSRSNFAPGAQYPPHLHPRAAEIIWLLEGSLEVGFLDTSSRLFATSLRPGDVMVFPKGLIHFQINADKSNSASAISAFSSQLPSSQDAGYTIFNSHPAINSTFLSEFFGVPQQVVKQIQDNL